MIDEKKVYDFSINPTPDINVIYIGKERQPILIVDNLMNSPRDLLAYASYGDAFKVGNKDYYPGVRKPSPDSYASNFIESSVYSLKQAFGFDNTSRPDIGISFLSITTCLPEKLLPIQCIPHFDSADPKQLAVVHYLCGKEHGGTSFYRHRETAYESINHERFKHYTKTLERQATTVGLPAPGYINGDSVLFERFARVEAKFNRALIYPGNLFHSGDINVKTLSEKPMNGRLTVTSSFIFNEDISV